MLIKVCGNLSLVNSIEVAFTGIDLMGFINIGVSPRHIGVDQARNIINELPASVKTVLVVADKDLNELISIVKAEIFDYIQLHGNESLTYIESLKKYNAKIIKAFKVYDVFPEENISQYTKKVDYILLDTYNKDKLGGTGEKFNWDILTGKDLSKVIVAGGVDVGDIEKLKQLGVAGIDVNSKVELAPGKKDIGKIEKIVRLIKGE